MPNYCIRGMVVRHGEAFTISDKLTVWKNGKAVYRPTMHYAYCPCDEAIASLADLKQVVRSSAAHAQEHSLEVQLPFLQKVLGDFSLVPIAAGAPSVWIGAFIAGILAQWPRPP